MNNNPTFAVSVAFSCLIVWAAACGGDGPAPDAIAFDEIANDAHEARPWARWWWPGGAVDDATLQTEIAWMASVGFGGAEVQAFDAALDPNARDGRVHEVHGTPYWGHARAALDAAENNDFALDFTVGSGWPVGGNHVSADDALTTLMWWEDTFDGPVVIDVVPTPLPTVFFTIAAFAEASFGERLARFLPELATPVAAYAAPITGGRRISNWTELHDTLTLDPDRVLDLTEHWVDGRLQADLPAGHWVVVAIFAGPDGEYLTLSAEPGDPFPVDHLDAAAVAASADALLGPIGPHSAWHGMFVDSLEFKVDRLFTDDFLAEFEQRRGYALDARILTVLTQSADSFLLDAGRVAVSPEFELGADDERVRWDYRETVSDLFIERFVGGLATWGESRDLTLRSQGFGIDIDVIRAAGAAHIPETETLYAGGASAFYKIASAGAHLYGRSLVAAEAFSFILRDHMTTPLKVRAAADKLFAAGVNHLVFHGVPYPAEGEYGITGWTPFSSPFGGVSTFGSTFGRAWEFAESLPHLTGYIARSQALLRQGTPQADVLVYYPFHGFPTSLALAESFVEPLLGGHMHDVEPASRDVPFASIASLLGPPVEDPRVTWIVGLEQQLDALEAAGLTWSWVNAERLEVAQVDEGAIVIGDARYASLLLYALPFITVPAAESAARLAAGGATVARVHTESPSTPSYAEAGDVHRIAEAFGSLPTSMDSFAPAQTVQVQNGSATVLTRALAGDQSMHFVWNADARAQTLELTISNCREATVYDAWDDRHWSPAAGFETGGVLPMPAYTARFIVCGQTSAGLTPTAVGGESTVVSTWQVHATSATGAFENVERVWDDLRDWRDDEALRSLAGPTVYTSTFTWDGGPGWLALHDVHGAATVHLNGQPVGRLDVPPWTLPLGEVSAGTHTLALHYTPPLRNELVAAAEHGLTHYAQFDGKEDTRVATGIVGPVHVVHD